MSQSPSPDDQPKQLTGKQVYNVVSDTAVGVNVRWRDNLFQSVAIFLCTAIGAGIGYFLNPRDVATGSVAGGGCGLLAGLFGSGLFLMIFRAVMHARGKHD